MKPRILVVEDDPQTRITLTRQLEYAGYYVTHVSDGEAALNLLEKERFDVVLTDMVMGEATGLEVLHAARLQSYRPQVILLTGHGTLETSLSAFRAGAFDYLLKPCEPEDLLVCIANAVQRSNAEQQLREVTSLLTGQSPSDEYGGGQLVSHAEMPQTNKQGTPPYHIGTLTIGKTRYEVLFNGSPVRLTPIEYTLLSYMAERKGKVCGFSEIIKHTHGFDSTDIEAQQLLKPHIHNLRQKLSPDYLVSYRGKGYALIEPDE